VEPTPVYKQPGVIVASCAAIVLFAVLAFSTFTMMLYIVEAIISSLSLLMPS
jgi:hypothetical protein